MPHHFTPEEANELLAAVRPLTERMVEHRRALTVALEKQERLTAVIRGNGGGIQPRAPAEIAEEREQAAAGIAHCVNAIGELGAVVKDLDRGLVDFPARRGDEDVYLCWQLGEDEIEYWHGIDEGFAGRRKLPL